MWGGISCSKSRKRAKYIKLGLSENHICGTLPDEIGALGAFRDLEFVGIDFTDNELTGSIPESLCNLSNIPHFSQTKWRFGRNHLAGAIPVCVIAHCEKDIYCDVSANAYLTLPTNIGDLDGKITNLGWTSSADLHGSIPPSIGKLASLQHLNLTFSFLTGQVPVVE